jgi:hypothetical protein
MAKTSTAADRSGGIKGRRRLIICFILGILWIGLGFILFVINRGHALLVDNRDVREINLRAPDLITVFVDGQRAMELLRGDRDRLIVKGINHHVRVEFSDGTAPFEGDFKLPLKDDMYIILIPRMVRGIEPFVEVFHTAPEPRVPEEELPQPEEEVLAP